MHTPIFRGWSRTRRRSTLTGAASLALGALGGIALPACVPMLAADAASSAATGKPTADHALNVVTGQDCRVVEGALRADRRVCEPPGAPATKRDFKGALRD